MNRIQIKINKLRAAYLAGATDALAETFSREQVEEAIRMAVDKVTDNWCSLSSIDIDEIINHLTQKP